MTRDTIASARTQVNTLSVPIDVNGRQSVYVSLMKPVHPNDAVFVEYEADALEQVILFLRNGAFELHSDEKKTSMRLAR